MAAGSDAVDQPACRTARRRSAATRVPTDGGDTGRRVARGRYTRGGCMPMPAHSSSAGP